MGKVIRLEATWSDIWPKCMLKCSPKFRVSTPLTDRKWSIVKSFSSVKFVTNIFRRSTRWTDIQLRSMVMVVCHSIVRYATNLLHWKGNNFIIHIDRNMQIIFVIKCFSSLRVHEKLHTGKEFICDVCGLSFQHPNYLRKHKRRHEEIKYKECKLCDKRYVQNVDLRLHMKKVHNIDVPVRNGKKTLE